MIPGSSKVIFGVRAPTMAEVEVLKVKVAKCFEAAALATGCEYTNNWVMSYAVRPFDCSRTRLAKSGFQDLRNNRCLISAYTDYMKSRFSQRFPVGLDLGGSTDFVSIPSTCCIFDLCTHKFNP